MRTALPTIRRVAVVLLAGAAALLLGAAPAWAHTELESSTPAANSAVAQAPAEVTLTFSEEVPAGRAEVTVTGPDGAAYAAGPATGRGDTLTVPLRPLGASGTYTVAYRVVSEDGHPVSGTVPFTLTAPGPGAAAPAAPGSAAGHEGSAGHHGSGGSAGHGHAPAPSAAAPAATEAPVAGTAGEGGAPVWPWLVAAVVVVGAGAAVALRRAKR